MYNIPALDTFFDDLKDDTWDEDTFPAAAESAERWLLGFVNKTNPEKAALAKLRQGESSRQDERLVFALAMAMCAPSTHTGSILQAFYGFLSKNGGDMADKVSFLSLNAAPEHQIDVGEAFRSLPDCNLHELAARLYRVTINNVLEHAIQWDDALLFRKAMRSEPDFQKYPVHMALAQFPSDKTTLIYKTFIENEQDEKDLFLHRMIAVRGQLEGYYRNGLKCLILPVGERPLLKPSSLARFDSTQVSDLMAQLPAHKTPEFAEAVHKDAYRIIRETFKYKPDGFRIDSAYWPIVDDLTQSFLDVGITPSQLVSHGACGQPEDGVSLSRALRDLGTMDHENLRFFQTMFQAYLASHDPQEIIAKANTPEEILAVYRITGDKTFLQNGNHRVREAALGSDLGL